MEFLSSPIFIAILSHNLITGIILADRIEKTKKNISFSFVLLLSVLFGWPFAIAIIYFTQDKPVDSEI